MSIDYFNNIQIKGIIARLRYHNSDPVLVDRVIADINFEVNFESFLRLSSKTNTQLVYDCLKFANYAHNGQTYRKYTDSQGLQLVPYLNHPLNMAIKAYTLGFHELIVGGCLVHDTLKATKIDESQLKDCLDPRIVSLVLSLNRKEGESKKEMLRRQIQQESYEVKAVKILDKWHSLLRSFTLYDPEYQSRLSQEVQEEVIPYIGEEFDDIKDDCHLFIEGIKQQRKPIFAKM
ncbi:MAG: hypothetical protein ACRCXZ_04715 [Patescibacteria group bacterium]